MENNQHYIHLKTIIQASPDIVVLKDSEGRWLEANKSALTIFNIDENYKGKTDEELGECYPHYKDLVPYFQESDRIAWEKGEVLEIEEVVPFNGEQRVFHVIKNPIYNENGDPNAIVVIGRDITDRLKRDQSYQMLFEKNPAAVYMLDDEGIFKEANQQSVSISGYSKGELTGMPFHKLVEPTYLGRMKENFEKLKKGIPQSSEIRIVRKDGEIRDVSLSATPISFYGEVTGIQGIAIDITEKNKAIKEAEELQKSLRDTVRQQQGMIFKFIKKGDHFIHELCDGELAYKIGLTPDVVVGKTLDQIWDKEFAVYIGNFYKRAWTGEEVHYEVIVKHCDIIYFAALRPIYRDGKIVEVIGSAVDITRIKKAEKALKESEERYRIIGQYSTDMILTLDSNYNISYASPSNQRVLGFSPEYLIGKNILKFIHPEDLSSVSTALEYVLINQKSFSTIGRFHTKSQEWVWTESTLSPVIEKNIATSIVVVSRNVEERKKFEEQLHYMAYHDSLTGLPNRRMFDNELVDHIKRAETSQQPFAILYFDVDRFKVVNDSLGHNMGDLLLIEIVKRLKSQLEKNVLFARMGGDEFAILVKNIPGKQYVKELAEKILLSMQGPYYIEGFEINVTTSIGISLFPDHSNNHDELMKLADIAMYHSKEKGKNTYNFYEHKDLNEKYNKLFLENDLRKALKNNELFMMYQPKVDVKSNKMVGCEAFLRWNHPTLGLISPEKFILIAEESGLIVPIGEWVLEEVCKQIKEWKSKIPIAINLSLKQTLSKSLVEIIKNILNKYQVEPKWIELEITESVIMKDLETTLYLLNEMKNEGISIAIDDFGTGYSSLAHLKQIPLNILKIDQSFIKDIPNDEENMAIVSLIISMGKFLNLTVVAEGVETMEQLQCLTELGCDQYQGYLFSRPLLSEDMTKYL